MPSSRCGKGKLPSLVPPPNGVIRCHVGAAGAYFAQEIASSGWLEMTPYKRSPFEATLRNGETVLIRPVTEADKHLLEVGFEHLSDRSRYFRFLRPISKLSEKQLNYFTDTEEPNHVALAALSLGRAGPDPAGIARYIVLEDGTDTAEFAITVVDSYQGVGLGSLLFGTLAYHAVGNGIAEFVGLVHRENKPMLHLLNELEASVTRLDSFERELSVALHHDPELYPATPAGEAMRQAYRLAAGGTG